jgi:ABC-type spermidine/putrescine transport system, permease component I
MQHGMWSRRTRALLLAAAPVSVAVTLGVIPVLVLLDESLIWAATPDITGILAAYSRVGESVYLRIIGRSILIGVMLTAACLVVAYPVTYWLAHRCQPRWRMVVLVLLTLPLWLNYVVLNYVWVWILARGGIVNHLLSAIHPSFAPVRLLYTEVSLTIGFIYIYLPYVILALYVAMERLDDALIAAASDLGAARVRLVIDIIIPQTAAGAAAGALIVYARIAGAFATPEILGGPQQQLVAQLITDAFLEILDLRFAAALAFSFLAVVSFVLVVGLTSRQLRRELRQW